MKLVCLQEKLKQALRATERIVGKNINLPVLNNVLIQAKKNHVLITSTDLEIAVSYSFPAKVEREGTVVVPSRLFTSFVNNLINSSQKIILEGKKYNISVKTKDYQAQILGVNPEDFPIIPQIKKQNPIVLSSKELVSGLERVVKSVGTSEVRPEITGILFTSSPKENKLTLVSTDSFRLSEFSVSLEKNESSDVLFILPLKAVNEIIRIFGEQEELLSFYLEDKNHILFEGENAEIVSRLIDGEFPNYKEIIPRKSSISVLVDKTLFVSKIKAISAFSGRSCDVVLMFDKKTLTLSAKEAGSGEGSAVITLKEGFPSEPLSVTFNWRFLLDGLEGIDSNEVEIKMNSEIQPVLFEPNSTLQYLYLLMPIKH